MRYLIEQEMTLMIQQRFHIYDETGRSVYYVDSEWRTSTLYLHVYDMNGNAVLTVKRKTTFITPACDLLVEGKKIATIEKEVTFMKPQFLVKDLNWSVVGDMSFHNYAIAKNGDVIGDVSKKMFNFKDTYVIDVYDDKETLYMLGIVIGIDCMLFKGKKTTRMMF